MKKILALIATLMVVSMLMVGCGPNDNSGPVDPVDPEPSVPSFVQAKDVVVERITVNNEAEHIYIKNEYPSIKSFKSKEFENYINKTIATNIASYRSEISEIVDDYTLDVKQYSYITSFDRYNWGTYLTLVVNQDYQTGGIRSNKWKEIYNIDSNEERIIYLEDLFRATVDYEDAIIAEITRQAAVKNYVLMGGDGLKKLPTKQKFYIREGKLIMYFDPSEIAANKYGALEFEMPFSIDNEGFFEVSR